MPIYHLSLPEDQNFFFQPTSYLTFNMYAHLLGHTNTKVVIRNNSNRNIWLLKKQKLGIISEFFIENCFSIKLKANITESPPIKLLFRDRTGFVIAAPDLIVEI